MSFPSAPWGGLSPSHPGDVTQGMPEGNVGVHRPCTGDTMLEWRTPPLGTWPRGGLGRGGGVSITPGLGAAGPVSEGKVGSGSPLAQMSQFIVQCLNPYRKPDCKVGRITTTEDFKHLARKVTSPLSPSEGGRVLGGLHRPFCQLVL